MICFYKSKGSTSNFQEMFKLGLISLSKISLILISLVLFFIKPSMGLDLKKSPESKENLKENSGEESIIPILRVYPPASPGSGVVIGKKNNIYTLLTAKHVVGDLSVNQKDEIEIEIAPDIFVSPLEVIVPFEDKDLAVLRFKSDFSIKLALLPFLDKPLWEKVNNWERINVQGFANESSGVREATFRKSKGSLLALIENNVDGYNLIHTSTTTTGMSGGGIFSGYNFLIHTEASPKVVDPEAEIFEYYYVSQKEIQQRDKVHNAWLERNKHRAGNGMFVGNFTEPFWDESIHSKAQNATYKKCMTNKWLPREDIIEKSDPPFVMLTLGGSDTKLGSPNLSDYHLWKHCSYLASTSERNYNCKSYYGWMDTDNDMYLLLAIHGRSEKYAYGGKSGAGLGIFLGETEIAKWLEKNASTFGILQDYSYAKRFCSHK